MADLISPDAVSDFLLTEMRERGELLTNLKLQKLLFYADGWHDALYGEALFGEAFQAWVHGPVLPSQYYRFRELRWRPIAVELDPPMDISAHVQSHLREIVDVFGSETAVALELMTHREPPWMEARGMLPADAPSTKTISKTTTREYFRSISENQEEQARNATPDQEEFRF